MNVLAYSWHLLRRDWRAGELRILGLAVMIAVAAVSAVGFFTSRVQQALDRQANELLGADLVIASDHPLAQDLTEHVQASGLRRAHTLEFFSMVLAGERNQLAGIKAVSKTYPLHGELRISSERFAPDRAALGIPVPGTVWMDARLLDELSLQVGDSVTLGEAPFKVVAILTHEPDRGSAWFSLAPRVLLNESDLPGTGLMQPGSRIGYRFLVAGTQEQIKAYRDFVRPHLGRGERIETVEDARPEIRTALERGRQFLGLASMISLLLAGLAITTATRRFVLRHLDNCAVMRCFGATQAQIVQVYLLEITWLGLLASLAGCAVGFVAQTVLSSLLGALAGASLPAPAYAPALLGMVTGLLTLLSFALPPLLHLRHVPPLRVLRKDVGRMPAQGWAMYVMGLSMLALLMLEEVGELKLGLYAVAGMAVTLVGLSALALMLMGLLRLFRRQAGFAWRFGLSGFVRRRRSSIMQLTAFGLGLMALLLLSLVRTDLFEGWRTSLPPDTPNRFIINVQPDQLEAVKRFFIQESFPAPDLFPMIRGRLTAINGHPVTPEGYADDGARRLVAREFNLTFMEGMLADNKIMAGTWWTSTTRQSAQFSVEEGIARTLGIKLGDRLTYVIAGEEITARVTSLRKVEWGSFHPNFFVIAPPATLQRYPATYMTSLYVPEGNGAMLNRLVRQFPNFTVIDTAVILAQVRDMLERVSLAMGYVFVFTLAAGVVVLYAAVQSTQDERTQESAILRMLGATRRQLLSGMFAEFVVLGLLAGVMAATAAGVVGYVLAERVFHFTYHWNGYLWLAGIAAGVVGALMPGLAGVSVVLRQSPWRTLREI